MLVALGFPVLEFHGNLDIFLYLYIHTQRENQNIPLDLKFKWDLFSLCRQWQKSVRESV